MTANLDAINGGTVAVRVINYPNSEPKQTLLDRLQNVNVDSCFIALGNSDCH